MVDRAARQELIRITKDFVGGRITNDELEDQVHEISSSESLISIFRYGLWTLYSDTREYKAVGEDKLCREERRFAAQIILFLQSDFEYRWSKLDAVYWERMLCYLLVLGIGAFFPIVVFFTLIAMKMVSSLNDSDRKIIFRDKSKELKKMDSDSRVAWPFFTREEYEYALAHPVYLAGERDV